MSPLMNSALNQVLSADVAAWPAIQWLAAARMGARPAQPGGAAGGAVDAGTAIPGTSPAAATTATAVTSRYLRHVRMGASLSNHRRGCQSPHRYPEVSMSLSAR